MFGILAKTLKTAVRTSENWSVARPLDVFDHRTRAQKERDAAERRRLLRQTGMM
ncbi:hypothetical protein [Gymnodinialimonas sp.]